MAHYAETEGDERDEFKQFTLRYRDCVIDACNRDLPYDRFNFEFAARIEVYELADQIRLMRPK